VDGPARKLPPAVHVALYRLAQEALNNVVKHARAGHASVGLVFTAGQVHLRVLDDGCGFVAETTGHQAGHFGLGIMRERAASIGAKLRLLSQPGEGTVVEVVWIDAEPPQLHRYTTVKVTGDSSRRSEG
jgi:signal transduction histidine kinase